MLDQTVCHCCYEDCACEVTPRDEIYCECSGHLSESEAFLEHLRLIAERVLAVDEWSSNDDEIDALREALVAIAETIIAR